MERVEEALFVLSRGQGEGMQRALVVVSRRLESCDSVWRVCRELSWCGVENSVSGL